MSSTSSSKEQEDGGFVWFTLKSRITATQAANSGAPEFMTGWGNGYVIIPDDHPGLSVDMNLEARIDVHGGVTFCEPITDKMRADPRWSEHLVKHPGPGTLIGFDTAHLYDNMENCGIFFVKLETLRLKKQLEKLYADRKEN